METPHKTPEEKGMDSEWNLLAPSRLNQLTWRLPRPAMPARLHISNITLDSPRIARLACNFCPAARSCRFLLIGLLWGHGNRTLCSSVVRHLEHQDITKRIRRGSLGIAGTALVGMGESHRFGGKEVKPEEPDPYKGEVIVNLLLLPLIFTSS